LRRSERGIAKNDFCSFDRSGTIAFAAGETISTAALANNAYSSERRNVKPFM
jgi:hypothetical protein